MTNQLQQLRQAAIQETQGKIDKIENRAVKQIEQLMTPGALPAVVGKQISKSAAKMFEPQIKTIINGLNGKLVPLYSRIAWLKLNNNQIITAFQKNTPPAFQIFPNLDIDINRNRSAWYVVLYDLIQEGLIPLQLKGVLYTQDNFGGSGFPIITQTPVIPANTRSIYPMPGFGLTVFAQENWTGSFQGVESPIGSFLPPAGVTDTDYSRLNAHPKSAKVWNAAGRPHKGGWIIASDAMPGAYLSVRRSNVLRHTGNVVAAGDFETFRFEVIQQISTLQTKIRLVVGSDADLTLEGGRGMAARVNEVFIMTERPDIGYRWFNLHDESGRPLIWKQAEGVFGYLDNYTGDPALFYRAVKVGNTELQVGELQMGEVALYANRNYWGKTWVLGGDLGDFSKIENLDNVISSVRLGPYAAATVFQDTAADPNTAAELAQLQTYRSQLQAQRTQLNRQFKSAINKLKKVGLPVNNSMNATQLNNILKSFNLPGIPAAAQNQALDLRNQIDDVNADLREVNAQIAQFEVSQQQDIVEDTPSLIGSQIGDDDMSGIDVWTKFSVEETGIEARSQLQEDFRVVNDKTERIMSYVTSLELPTRVEWVEVAATDDTEIEVATKTYNVSEIEFARFDTPSSRLTITSEARGIATPALKIRTSLMPAESWTVIFPDRSTHQQISELEDDALYNATITVDGVEKPVVKRDTFTKEQVASVQKAIGYALEAIQYDEAAEGGTAQTTRYVSALGMRQSSFVLDLGNKTDSLRPISGDELGAEVDSVVGTMGQGLLKKLKKKAKKAAEDVGDAVADAAEDVGNAVVDTAEDVGNAVVDTAEDVGNAVVDAAEDVGDAVVDTAEDVGEWTEDAVEDASDWVEGAVEDTGDWAEGAIQDIDKVIIAPVGDLIENAADFSDELVGEIKELGVDFMRDPASFGNVLVAVIVDASGEVTGFVMDTADKVVTFVEAVVETVVEAVEEFVEFLAYLFDWGDIIKVQKAIQTLAINALDYVADAATSDAVTNYVNNFVDDLASNVVDPIRKYADKLAGDSTYDSSENPASGLMSEAMDKLDWLMSKVFGLMPDVSFGSLIPPGMDDEFEAIADGFKSVFLLQADLLIAAGDAGWDILNMIDDVLDGSLSLKEFCGHLLNALTDIIEAAFDGVKTAVDALFGVVGALVSIFKALLQLEWKIPGLKDFFEWISMGQELNLINLVSLIGAVPATLLGKLMGLKVDDLAIPALAQATSMELVAVWMFPIGVSFSALGLGIALDLDAKEAKNPKEDHRGQEALALCVGFLEQACGFLFVVPDEAEERTWAWIIWSYGIMNWIIDAGFYFYGLKNANDDTDPAMMRRANAGGAILGSALGAIQLGLTSKYIAVRIPNRKSNEQKAMGTLEDIVMVTGTFPKLLSAAHFFNEKLGIKDPEAVLLISSTVALFSILPAVFAGFFGPAINKSF